jgi:hypothetical protein
MVEYTFAFTLASLQQRGSSGGSGLAEWLNDRYNNLNFMIPFMASWTGLITLDRLNKRDRQSLHWVLPLLLAGLSDALLLRASDHFRRCAFQIRMCAGAWPLPLLLPQPFHPRQTGSLPSLGELPPRRGYGSPRPTAVFAIALAARTRVGSLPAEGCPYSV